MKFVELKNRCDLLFKDKKLIVLELLKDRKVLVETTYGKCITYENNLLKGFIPTILTSVDKNEFFKNKIKDIHGNIYDYTLTNYINNVTPIKIICKEHGVFSQRASIHLAGIGCKKCSYDVLSKERSRTNESFIKESIKLHNNKYSYEFTNYINSWTKVNITCKIHGIFTQNPTKHLNGQGCAKCAILAHSTLSRSTNKEFIIKANKTHNFKYDYSTTDYKHAHEGVKIICGKHGEFEQVPSTHLSGAGCPKCGYELSSKRMKENPSGWRYSEWENKGKISKRFEGFKVYIIKCWNDDEEFYKIGKTYIKINYRFSGNTLPYNYKIINVYYGEAREMSELENKLKSINKENKYIPKLEFGGMYECFKQLKDYAYIST